MAKYATPKDPNFQKIVGRVVLFSRDSAVHVQKAWDHWLSSKGMYAYAS
ncbi:hypothetical protein CGCF415_v015116 [Colletotrichum fructicola]|nr:hypothetical protein CGCF415_v015116 [Colletotrichum fructicola]KAF4923311.1 hypothetical protein CGCF245_v014991 [Colletotrichum fructicola]